MSADQDADNDNDRDEYRRAAVFRAKGTPPRTLGTAARLHPIKHRIPLYSLDLVSGDIKSAPARKAPEIPESSGRTPGISSAVADDTVFSGWARMTGPAFAVCSGATGVASPEVPGGTLLGNAPGLPGLAPGAVDVFGGALRSALRMIGKPSLPEPMTTTFALGDCESKSVASIPRQRK